ncbi:MAG: hypothetical protein ACREN8_12535 [Candidatus Dormibacteraceae bacterium]
MQRATITLPEDLAVVVKRKAHQAGLSFSGFIQKVLSENVGLQKKSRPLHFIGLGRSKFSDTSERVEEILAEEWKP